ncbi:hypothetical protein ACIGJO_31755 [Streptomyces sp. NPDC079020]|uniref:hypothetical protein n=1 Tax=Streptomyces sp. NPDC079020 TaxID=3365722 RepID=UPI0037D36515
MDLFDWELGGRNEHGVESGGGCSWVTVVLIGILVGLVMLASAFFGFLRGLL